MILKICNFLLNNIEYVLLDSDKMKIRIQEVLNNSNIELSMNLLRKKIGLVKISIESLN